MKKMNMSFGMVAIALSLMSMASAADNYKEIKKCYLPGDPCVSNGRAGTCQYTDAGILACFPNIGVSLPPGSILLPPAPPPVIIVPVPQQPSPQPPTKPVPKNAPVDPKKMPVIS